ncbi:MAG: hypothetical protein C0623_12475 [Desulfuromonas sp.]|nr:MAG: hypothetical protein C0623_12475 [Desulfuromonas sp.]
MRILMLVLSLVILLPLTPNAQTLYTGEQTLWQDTIWEGDILIDGIVTVAPDVTLQVRPGTIVRFTRRDSNNDGIGTHELFVQGRFLALGTAERPIIFTSAEADPVPGDWGAINMMASNDENRFEHCLFEYGYRGFHAHFARARLAHSQFRYNQRGAQFQESTVSLVNCRFEDNFNGIQFRDSSVELDTIEIRGGYWGLRCVYSTLQMSHSIIENNLVNGANFRDSEITLTDNVVRDNRRGVYLQRTRGSFMHNLVENNREHGLYLEESPVSIKLNRIVANGRAGLRVINSQAIVADNEIIDNGEYGLINDGDRDFTVEANWWGTSDKDVLSAMIRDGDDRQGLGRVMINGLLEEPLAQ